MAPGAKINAMTAEFSCQDEAFRREALRAVEFSGDAGADGTAVLTLAARIPDGADDAWLATWRAAALRAAGQGEDSLAAGDVVSAREAFLRASNFFRMAELPCRGQLARTLEALGLSRCARHYFVRAAQMMGGRFTEVVVPFEGGGIPAYLFLVDDSGTPRPTVVYTGGLAANREEGYAVIGAAALRRGYNFLAYDGPGQGETLREKGIPMRSDWENVLGPVVDFALTVPEIDDDAIVHFGHGLGGYLVARHASHHHRSAAIVCNDGMTTFYAADPSIPESILEFVEDGRDDDAMPMLEVLMKEDTGARWGLNDGRWGCGVETVVDYVRATAEYSLTAARIQAITTPVLVLECESDTAYAGQAANFARAMTAPVHHVVLHDASSAVHQTVFNYLATTLPQPRRSTP